MIWLEKCGYHMGNSCAVPFLDDILTVDKLDVCAFYLPAVCDIHLGNGNPYGSVLNEDDAVFGNGG